MLEAGPVESVLDALLAQTPLDLPQLLIVGAAARDLVITAATGTTPARATEDVDIAFGIESWDAFGRITERLAPIQNSAHTFDVAGIEVDLVPFGEIEEEDRSIVWPDDMTMNLFGFREAYDNAVEIELANGMTVKVASLEGQFVLKLVAWSDRKHRTTKDAVDLRSILDAAGEQPFINSLFEVDLEVLERYEYDYSDAGAHRVARDAARFLDLDGVRVVQDILAWELGEVGTLAAQMSANVGRNRELLNACLNGVVRA